MTAPDSRGPPLRRRCALFACGQPATFSLRLPSDPTVMLESCARHIGVILLIEDEQHQSGAHGVYQVTIRTGAEPCREDRCLPDQ